MLALRVALGAAALGLLCGGCSPDDGDTSQEEEACPSQPRFCELFTFVRSDDGVSLRSAFDQDIPAPASDVHCVLEAIQDGTPSTHTFTDGYASLDNGAGALSRSHRTREVAVFEEGHVEVVDSATPGFDDPATQDPRRAQFEVRANAFFESCLASSDAEVLRDCLWAFEAQEVPKSGCRAPVGAAGRDGEPEGE